MGKRTTSDQLKKIFAQHGGDEKDWKRLSKRKEDGQWVRIFENKKLGTKLEVIELGGGKFLVGKLTPAANANFERQDNSSPTETDPAQNAAADKVIEAIMNGGETDDAAIKDLFDAAGKALANRFYFAVYDKNSIAVTPIRYFEERGCMCEDFESWPVDHLIPNCRHTQEPFRDIGGASLKTPLDAARYMQGLGFVWNRECQNEVEAGLTEELEAALQPPAPTTGAPTDKEMAGQYTFAVTYDEDMDQFCAIITPTDYWLKEGCCYDRPSEIHHLLPEGAEDMNDCGSWFFTESNSTATILAQGLLDRGFVWDKKFQDFTDETMTGELEAAFLPAAQKTGTSIETDSAKNAAADKVIAIVMGNEPRDNGDDASYGVSQKLLDEAGKALANRYCFAICGEVLAEGGDMTVMITPIEFFEESGCCSDQTGPIYHLLPKCAEAAESTWEIYDASVETPLDAVKYLQQLGFVWNKDFQDFIDSPLTKELEAALEPKNTPSSKRGGNTGPKAP